MLNLPSSILLQVQACITCLMTVVFYGCSEDAVEGCTDADAENYDSVADSDDGSCTYSGSYAFFTLGFKSLAQQI